MPYLRCPCPKCGHPALINEKINKIKHSQVCPKCGNLLYISSHKEKRGDGEKCPVCGRYTWFNGKCTSCGAYYDYKRK